ncbi:NnrS family protein [Verrucomicrobiaceae bacterium 227]
MAQPSRLDRYCAEPFRVFFPLGILASIIGVLLWPASYAGWLPTYPLEAHARWLALGFGGSMIAGFLGTAGPRLLDSAPWSRFEFILHLTMALVMMACLAAMEIAKADFMACFWLLGILGSMLWRVLLDRQDTPPPGLPLVFLGLLLTAISTFALALSPLLNYRFEWNQFWRLLAFQGLFWFPITGVAPYLLPRFFGKKSRHSFDEDSGIPPAWRLQFLFASSAGLLLLASFIVEAHFNAKAGLILRTVTVVGYLGAFVPGLISCRKVNALALAVRWILPMSAAAWLAIIIWPHFRIGLSHLMFIGGAGALILAVATRVILGHNDRHDRLAAPMKWYHLIWSGLLFTAATRLSADFIPKVRQSHLIYAAALWVLLVLFWAWKVRRELKTPQEDPDRPRKRCPKRPKTGITPSS